MPPTPDPARVHAAMVLAFAERERMPEEDVRDLLFERGYDADEIMTALANLPPLPRGFRLPPPRTKPLPTPAPKAQPLPSVPKSAPPMPKLEPPAPAPLPPPPAPAPAPEPAAAAPVPAPKAEPAPAPKPEQRDDAELDKLAPPVKTKPMMQPLPPSTGKAPPKQAKRGRPAQGAWLFAGAAGVILLVLIAAFSCGRTAPPAAGTMPTSLPAAP
jgi:outer membrane biosynthesis protein TonB